MVKKGRKIKGSGTFFLETTVYGIINVDFPALSKNN